jgi:4'-phosphopantetheinyl transferase
MIEWLIQCAPAHSDLARGCPPDGLLSESELCRFEGLKTDKRRHEWLIGRWTAKHLLQSYIQRCASLLVPLDRIVIESDPDGAPRIEIQDQRLEIDRQISALQSPISSLQLSISHRADRALCAISDIFGCWIGADIELVEPRAPGFAADYFTSGELEQLDRVPPGERDVLITLIWSAKEAALKALRLGLTVDTRAVSCAITPPDRLHDDWTPLAIRCDSRLLGRPAADLDGWWRVHGGYVSTLALMRASYTL